MTSSVTDNIEECTLEDLVQKGKLDDIIKKLETISEPLNENYYDYSLVITALSQGHTKVAKFLIDNGFQAYKISKSSEKTPLHYAVELGDHQLIYTILSKGGTHDVAALDERQKTPLMIAVERQNMKAVDMLVLNVGKTILDNMCALHYAIMCHDMKFLKLLLSKGLSPLKKNEKNQTAFCVAIEEDLTEFLFLLYESYPEIMDNGPNYNTILGLLFVAVIIDDHERMVEILDGGSVLSVNTVLEPCNNGWALFDYYAGFSLLHCAVKHTQTEIVNTLLERDAKIQIEDATGSSPLHIALDIKEETLDTNPSRYKVNEKILKALIFHTQDPSNERHLNAVNKYGISHFHIVCTQNNIRPINYFLKVGASLTDSVYLSSPIFQGFSPLHFAVKFTCNKTVKILLEKGANIEQEAHNKMTPLHIAAKESTLKMVKLLIKYGADITKQDSDGNTPVHYAFQAKNYSILDFLLTVHVIIRLNPVNSAGISHFHMACTRNDVCIVASFLRNGATANDCIPVDPNISYVNHNDIVDWRGCSPLHFAAAFNRKEVVQFLLEQGADVEICDARGLTPFHMACQYTFERFLTVIEDSDELNGELICEEEDKGYNFNEDDFVDVAGMENEFNRYNPYQMLDVCDEDEESGIVDWAPNRRDQINIIQLLIQYNSDVNKLDNFGNGPLFYVCYFNLRKILATLHRSIKCKSIIRMLLVKSFVKELCFRRQIIFGCITNHGVNMEQCYNNGSILHYVSVDREYSDFDRMDMLRLFLNSGANVNATDDKMRTPLHLATQIKDLKSVEILLNYNADVNCVEAEDRKTPLHFATSSVSEESIEIIYLLLKKEPDVNMKQLDGRTPLHNLLSKRYTCYSDIQPIFHSFISLGADIDAPDNRGKTPLFVACTATSWEVIEDLLKFGADVTVVDGDGVNIYQYVFSQIKTIMVAYQKLHKELFHIFWILLRHAAKLEILELIDFEPILQIWFELRKLLKPSKANHQNQDLTIFTNRCYQEIEIFQNSKIYNDVSIYNLLFLEDHEMIKYIDNDALKAVIESDSFEETYVCYGYLLKLKFNRGVERSELLPAAKQCFAALVNICLSDWIFEYIFMYLNNTEVRKFIRTMSLVKPEIESPSETWPLKMNKDYSKYSRLG